MRVIYHKLRKDLPFSERVSRINLLHKILREENENMIPKVIHYCWFGGKPLPELAQKCLASWKKYCPDYELMRWDESNFDVNCCDYVREAYEAKKWAFVSDYARLKVLIDNGGVYMDTDVEVLKPLDTFIKNNKAFSGFENSTQIPTGIMASEKEHPFFKELLNYYNNRHFFKSDGSFDLKTNVTTITEIAKQNGFIPNDRKQTICGMTFYPHDFFCPKSYATGQINATENTVCIHHFNGSWLAEEQEKNRDLLRWLIKHYGKFGTVLYKIYLYSHNPALFMEELKEKFR